MYTDALILSIALAALVAAPFRADDFNELLPVRIEHCLGQPSIIQRAEISRAINPFYLRADFDGDGKPDYAVSVRGKRSRKQRVLMCMGNGRTFLLGSENDETPFSDVPEDNFFAPTWMVYSPVEAREIGRHNSNEPQKLKVVIGDVLVMWWEDGMAAIYWDGRDFRWAGPKH